jgi:hypothetical protein
MGLSRVTVEDGGQTVALSLDQFLALPLDRRVQLILAKQIQFHDETGVPISATDGLKLLKEMRRTPVGP